MNYILGIDTSNYTTSVAVIEIGTGKIEYKKKLLTVKKGDTGLRQSEALFQHVKQLPIMTKELFSDKKYNIKAIGVTDKPRNIENSYMPVFLAGLGIAEELSAVLNVPLYRTSHQINHILAAIHSINQYNLLDNDFFAFHVSGGTTDCVKISHDNDKIIKCMPYTSSLDLKAGQAIDRVGVTLGLDFPAGIALEKLAAKSNAVFHDKIQLKSGNCCLSGLENKCSKMKSDGCDSCDIAKYCLWYIAETISAMCQYVKENNNNAHVLFAGGVMSDIYIQNKIDAKFDNVYFSLPEFSSDNAVGAAVYAALKTYGKTEVAKWQS